MYARLNGLLACAQERECVCMCLCVCVLGGGGGGGLGLVNSQVCCIDVGNRKTELAIAPRKCYNNNRCL